MRVLSGLISPDHSIQSRSRDRIAVSLAHKRSSLWLARQRELGGLVVMCAEVVAWRCHRSLIADAVMVRDVEVQDVFVSPEVKASLKSITERIRLYSASTVIQ